MSYQEKYRKYKSKYLQLVALKKNLEQLGGGRRNISRTVNSETESVHNFMSLNNLTETPTHNETSEFKKPQSQPQSQPQHNSNKYKSQSQPQPQHNSNKSHNNKSKKSKSKSDLSDELSSSTSQVSTTDSFELSSSDESL
jgi:hypothetical protein